MTKAMRNRLLRLVEKDPGAVIDALDTALKELAAAMAGIGEHQAAYAHDIGDVLNGTLDEIEDA